MAHDFVVPGLPHAQLSTVMLLIIAIVGTTVAPWQLFFQQSYIIDKRITPRFINYERADLCIGIAIVVVGAAAMFGFSDVIFAGRTGFGHFTDAAGVAQGLGTYASRVAGDLFAIALLDASIIGAAAVGAGHGLCQCGRARGEALAAPPGAPAKGFYACYCGLMAIAAALVLVPAIPLGLLTEGVQTLAGVLLPSATVFLLLLCNDKDVLGPWVNSSKLNVFTAAVVVGPCPALDHPDRERAVPRHHQRPDRWRAGRWSDSGCFGGLGVWRGRGVEGSRAHGAHRVAGPSGLAYARTRPARTSGALGSVLSSCGAIF